MRNRFKGRDLIECLRNYGLRFLTLYKRQGSRPSPRKRNAKKKKKWLLGEALQIAVKRREAKSKGEKERYKHMNAEFQRIERRDKKAFFNDQCKEIGNLSRPVTGEETESPIRKSCNKKSPGPHGFPEPYQAFKKLVSILLKLF